jgi:hypothetical protein
MIARLRWWFGIGLMHHKRKKPKNARAGCLMCKFHKVNDFNKAEKLGGVGGFGKIRSLNAAKLMEKE